jgi:hypothetical protein
MNRRSIIGNRRSIRWSILTRQRRAKINTVAPEEPMGQHGLSDGHVKANKDDLAAGSSALDELTVRRCIASE